MQGLAVRPRLGTPHTLDAPRFHRGRGRSQVDARHPRDALLFQATVVDADLVPRPLQSLVGLGRPGCAGRIKPGPRFQRLALPRPTLRRFSRVVAPEPLRRGALEAVVPTLANHQVTVRVGAVPGVNRQRVGQPLPVGQVVGKADCQLPALFFGQRHGQGKFQPLAQPPVGPLVLVGRVPVGGRLAFRPAREVAGLSVHQLGALVPAVLGRPLDVGGGGPGRLAFGPRAGPDAQMVDGTRREGAAGPGKAAAPLLVEAGQGVIRHRTTGGRHEDEEKEAQGFSKRNR